MWEGLSELDSLTKLGCLDELFTTSNGTHITSM